MVNNFTKYNVNKVIYLFYKKQTTLINYLTSSPVIMIGQGKEAIQSDTYYFDSKTSTTNLLVSRWKAGNQGRYPGLPIMHFFSFIFLCVEAIYI